jgi:enterochelin esterase-like enzyme
VAPRRTATPTQVNCLSLGGRIENGSLETKLLRLPLTYRVYTPPCYEHEDEQRYAVLFLFHGQGSTDDQWDRLGVDETADRLIAKGEIPPFIMVMPHDRYGGQPTETKFSQAITEVLMPYIDENYRTIPDRAHRAVGGLSRGAGWAVHFGISEWEQFGALGAHSAAVFHTDAQRMRTWLGQIPAAGFPRIYVDIGDKDRPEIMRSSLWFEELLDAYDIPHEWHLFSGYHAEEYWKAHLEQYLRWYTQGW